MGNKFIKGDPNRQELLETALKWIANKENKTIEEYMSEHQHDANADELWNYFQNVINWVKDTFPEGCREEKFMKGLPWGEYYNKYSEYTYDPEKVEKEVNELMADEDVTNRKGIYLYVLSKDYDSTAERHLNIRAFEDKDKKRKYEEQGHKCAKCGKEFKFEEMQGDHIIPWSLGGHTEYSNLQMLCQKCNASKSNK